MSEAGKSYFETKVNAERYIKMRFLHWFEPSEAWNGTAGPNRNRAVNVITMGKYSHYVIR